MKNKIIVLLLSVVMVVSVFYVQAQTPKPQETEEVIEPPQEEVRYLTDEDFSLLYTCRPEQRNADLYNFTTEECSLLMKVAMHEAGDLGVIAQYYVMAVIINRLHDDQFPDTIEEIVFQDKQFVAAKFLKSVEPNIDSHLALVLLEQGVDISQGALYFEASSNTPNSWHSKNREFLYEKYGQRYYK